jgi:hypothetical protein
MFYSCTQNIQKIAVMEQMNVSEEKKVSFDFSRFRLPRYVGEFQPLLFKEGDSYCAILGPDLQYGIFGRGSTPEAALADWNDNLLNSLRHPDLDNPVMQFVIDTINTKKKDVW